MYEVEEVRVRVRVAKVQGRFAREEGEEKHTKDDGYHHHTDVLDCSTTAHHNCCRDSQLEGGDPLPH